MTKLLRIPKWLCSLYMHCLLHSAEYPRRDIGLIDKDCTNYVYHSKRSKCMYVYVRCPMILALNWLIVQYLSIRMGHSFRGSINAKAAPCFIYDQPGCDIKAHRDRDMLNPENASPKFVAVLCLKDECTGGSLFVNSSLVHTDDTGKEAWERDETKRKYFNLSKGDLIVFNNQQSIHGVTPLKSGTRITTGFRSKP